MTALVSPSSLASASPGPNDSRSLDPFLFFEDMGGLFTADSVSAISRLLKVELEQGTNFAVE
jgi:hypothetical protein